MSVQERHDPHPFDDLEQRLMTRFSPPLRPDDVRRRLAETAVSFEDARVTAYLPLLIERAAVDHLLAVVRQCSPEIRLVSQGGA